MLHKIKWLQSQVTHAVFKSLVNRLLSTPLEQTEYTKEYKHILNTAVVNGFDKQLVDNKITAFRYKYIKIKGKPGKV